MGAGAGASAGIAAAVAVVKDDELVEMMKKLPGSEREKIAKALSGTPAAMSGEASKEEPKKQEPEKKPETNFTVTVVKPLSGEAILDGVEVGANEQVRVLMFRVADVLGESHRVRLFAGDRELSADTYMEESGLKDGSTVTALTKPVRVLKSTGSGASAELKADGSVVVFGKGKVQDQETADVQDQLTADVQDIVASDHAFAALKAGGSVVAWGNSACGGDCSKAHTLEGVPADLVDVQSIYSDSFSFAAKKADGSIVTWGNAAPGDFTQPNSANNKAKAAP